MTPNVKSKRKVVEKKGEYLLVQFAKKCWNTSLKIRAGDARHILPFACVIITFRWHVVRFSVAGMCTLLVVATGRVNVVMNRWGTVYRKTLIAGATVGVVGAFGGNLKAVISKITHVSKQA